MKIVPFSSDAFDFFLCELGMQLRILVFLKKSREVTAGVDIVHMPPTPRYTPPYKYIIRLEIQDVRVASHSVLSLSVTYFL